jgi:hypothetical protein
LESFEDPSQFADNKTIEHPQIFRGKDLWSGMGGSVDFHNANLTPWT